MARVQVDGRVEAVRVRSRALGLTRRVYVYRPPGAGGARLPVLFLLRGHEREWVNPREDGTRRGTAIDVYEGLLAAGAVGPMLLVMPGLASADNGTPSALADMRAPELAAGRAGVGRGAFARHFFDELLPLIDASYPTAPEARGLDGFSLGGLMSIAAAARRPDCFVSAGSYDGTILYSADGGLAHRPTDGVLRPPMFDAAFGVPRDAAHIAAYSPIPALCGADREAIRRITWIVRYGPQALEPWGSNFYRGEHLLRALAALGATNALADPVLPDGDHTWASADRHLAGSLPIHWAAMARAMG